MPAQILAQIIKKISFFYGIYDFSLGSCNTRLAWQVFLDANYKWYAIYKENVITIHIAFKKSSNQPPIAA